MINVLCVLLLLPFVNPHLTICYKVNWTYLLFYLCLLFLFFFTSGGLWTKFGWCKFNIPFCRKQLILCHVVFLLVRELVEVKLDVLLYAILSHKIYCHEKWRKWKFFTLDGCVDRKKKPADKLNRFESFHLWWMFDFH